MYQSLFCPLTQEQKKRFIQEKELDFAYSLEDKARFRVNVFINAVLLPRLKTYIFPN